MNIYYINDKIKEEYTMNYKISLLPIKLNNFPLDSNDNFKTLMNQSIFIGRINDIVCDKTDNDELNEEKAYKFITQVLGVMYKTFSSCESMHVEYKEKGGFNSILVIKHPMIPTRYVPVEIEKNSFYKNICNAFCSIINDQINFESSLPIQQSFVHYGKFRNDKYYSMIADSLRYYYAGICIEVSYTINAYDHLCMDTNEYYIVTDEVYHILKIYLYTMASIMKIREDTYSSGRKPRLTKLAIKCVDYTKSITNKKGNVIVDLFTSGMKNIDKSFASLLIGVIKI